MKSTQSKSLDPLVQGRIALVGKLMGALTLLGAAANGTFNPEGHLRLPPFWLLLACGLVWMVQWLVCRGKSRPARLIWAVEFVCMQTAAFLVGLATRFSAAGYMPMYVEKLESNAVGVVFAVAEKQVALALVLGLSYAAVFRSALVPAPPRNSLMMTICMGLCVLAVHLIGDSFFGFSPPPGSVPDLGLGTEIAVWWTFTCLIVYALSRIVHGLHTQVLEARKLGHYHLESRLGEGGMGVVYRAKHALMRRPTAIKLLPPNKSSPETITRFEREVQQTARLTHPNTITIFDYGRAPDGVFYYAMELLEGATLDAAVRSAGRFPPARVLHVMTKIAAALKEAHDIGLIHRDIKPGNIMLCRQGGEQDVPKLLDFGLVRQVEAGSNAQLTHDQTITGTPMYMSPESLTSPNQIDGRSDLYALGAVGYFMLTGADLFEARTVVELCGFHLHTDPIPPSDRIDAPLPSDLEAVVMQCLRKSPDDRPQSAGDLLQRLSACQHAGQWTSAQANEWWEGPGSQLLQASQHHVSSSTQTIAVHLNR